MLRDDSGRWQKVPANGYNEDMTNETVLLNELLDPVGRIMNRDELEQLVNLRAPAAVQARLDELAEKSTAGTLGRNEQIEYDSLISAGTLIAVLQSKARKLLKDGGLN